MIRQLSHDPDLSLAVTAIRATQHEATAPSLLSTKLRPPRLSSSLVVRQPLLHRLDEGFTRRLTLVAAPAGFGKSTLVAQWLTTRSEGKAALPTAWVALDPGDNDPVRFWRYVITACQAFGPEVGRSSLAFLRASQQPATEEMLVAFINELATLPDKCVLVLEDYQVITVARIHNAVAFLLEHLPETLHVVLISRSAPPLPLARLRAAGELNELLTADLRFTSAESEALIRQSLPFALSTDAIACLEARAEGWAAGLRLIALALAARTHKRPEDIETFVSTFTGVHQHILAYLIEEVLHGQPPDIQDFLLQTSFLDRLSGSLCDAVTGRRDGQAMLERLEREGLFLIPLDEAQHWYRYHALFAEAMQHAARQRLTDEDVRALLHKASVWYEAHGELNEAVATSFAAADYARAAMLLEAVVEPELINNEFFTLGRWLEQLPEDVLHAHPALAFAYAHAILFTSDRRAASTHELLRAPLQAAEQAWQAEGNRPKLGEVLAFRALAGWWANDPQATSLAQQALQLLPVHEAQWRGISLIFVGWAELLAGEMDAAWQTFTEARARCQAAGNVYGSLSTLYALGEVSVWRNEPHQAAEFYRQVLAEAERAPINRNQATLDMGRALIGLGTLYLEWNDLDAAEAHLKRAMELRAQLREESELAYATRILAQVKYARGETVQARHDLQSLIAGTASPLALREALASQAWLAFATGDLAAAQRWRAAIAQQPSVPPLQHEREDLIVARMLIARGDADASLHLLERWRSDAHDKGRAKSELEILVITALAHFKRDDRHSARRALTEALALARPGSYQRLFLNEGEPMAELLRAVLPELKKDGQDALLAYARSLLRAFPREPLAPRATLLADTALLIEPLSQQELRVLRLLVAGLPYPRIAEELVVSVNTIKSQVQSIYRKLNVNSREEASDAARRLNLL